MVEIIKKIKEILEYKIIELDSFSVSVYHILLVIAIIGITDYAQGELGDIVFVELPMTEESFKKGDTFGTVEAVKTVSDLYMPISGDIVEINKNLEDYPELINNEPYGNGWLIKIKYKNLIVYKGIDGYFSQSEELNIVKKINNINVYY